jgi:ferritin-like metal-binding protein YciE
MATEPKEHLIDWLRDAHGMEQQAETMLKSMAERLEHYPVLRARIVEHISETQWQRQQLETCLARLGSGPSAIKDLTGKVVAFGQASSGMLVSDEVVKGGMSGYVFENMEIASYTVLIAAARAVGDSETALVCERILEQERAMAAWLLEHLPSTVDQFLSRSATPGVSADR